MKNDVKTLFLSVKQFVAISNQVTTTILCVYKGERRKKFFAISFLRSALTKMSITLDPEGLTQKF